MDFDRKSTNEAAAQAEVCGPPSARWRVNGETDPHAGQYDCERAALAMGNLTDDELANGAFMNYDVWPNPHDVIAGRAFSPIAWMTAVKDRIRWLSRSLEAALSTQPVQAQGEAVAQACGNGQLIWCSTDAALNTPRGTKLYARPAPAAEAPDFWKARHQALCDTLNRNAELAREQAKRYTTVCHENNKLRKENDRLRALAASAPSQAERIAELEAEIEEARRAPWPEWAETILKLCREVSGYDGYDDADAVDLVEEVRENFAELQAEIERLKAKAPSQAGSCQASGVEQVTMPPYWSVEVCADGESLVSIGENWLSGERPLEQADERTILGAAQHLLSFIGHGLPVSNFNPDDDGAPPAGRTLTDDAETFKAAMKTLHHADYPGGNLWEITTVREKSLMLKAWRAASSTTAGEQP